MEALCPSVSTTFYQPKPLCVILEDPEKFLTEESTSTAVPGIRSDSKGDIPKVAPKSTIIGVDRGVVRRRRGSEGIVEDRELSLILNWVLTTTGSLSGGQ